MTIPNLLTSIRIILAPVFIINLLNDRFGLALGVFILAGLTDAADGMAARLLHQKSRLGSYLDPLADKILLIAAFVVLGSRALLPAWLAVVVISRDVLILLGVLILSLFRGFSSHIRPSWVSKLTTCFQLLTVFLVLLQYRIPGMNKLGLPLFWTTGILTIVSGLHYMAWWFRMMGEGDNSGGTGDHGK